jgi:hypothetical protein
LGYGAPVVFFGRFGGEYVPPGGGLQGSSSPTAPLDDWFAGLSLADAICWVFNVCEGDLEELYWKYSFDEFAQRIQLKYGEMSASHLSNYNGLVQVVSAAFGSGDKGKGREAGAGAPSGYTDVTVGAPNIDVAVMNINNMLKF